MLADHDDTSPSGVLLGDVFRSRQEILERSSRVAGGFAAAGVGAGDTVALLLRNDQPLFEISFAAAALGALPVPLNWHGTTDELGYVLADSQARLVVAHADLLPTVELALGDLPRIVVPTPAAIADRYWIPADRCCAPLGATQWEDWLASHSDDIAASAQPPFSMVYTSGTTGKPKGVRRAPVSTMPPEDIGVLVAARNRIMGFVRHMRVVVTGPMYHSAPNAFALGALQNEGFVVLQPRFDAEELLMLIERHRITHLSLVPTMFVRLLRLPEAARRRYDLSSLRHVVHGAAPCAIDVKRAMIDWFGPIIWEYYGGTETGLVTGCDSHEWLDHPGSVGRPIDGATVRIYGDDGRVVPDGQPGEVFMRSRGMPDFTYEGRPREREECERDGLITCGDLGFLDPDGFLHLCGRKRDLVISGGVNIYPVEIEECLLTLAGLRDVAVFGIPDDEYGEALAAVVEPERGATLTADDVRTHVASKLASFKVPRVVTFSDQLPREDSGKIFKQGLRAPYWERAGRSI